MILRVVRHGEFLSSIALQYGLSPEAIWDHPENADLARRRSDPRMLCEGDVLMIPEPPPRQWLPVEVGAKNEFVARVPTVSVRLRLVAKGGPLKSAICAVSGVPGVTTATADAEGVLTLELPVTTRAVTLDVEKPRFHAVVRLGYMDPPDTPSGIRMRLRNLHYLYDEHAPGEYAARAIADFQRARGLEPTGVADRATCAALVDAHGC